MEILGDLWRWVLAHAQYNLESVPITATKWYGDFETSIKRQF